VRFDVITTTGGTVAGGVPGAGARPPPRGPHARGDGPELGHRHRPVRQDLEEEGLELVVGPVDLVDEEDRRRSLTVVADGPQQRPAHQEPLVVEPVLDVVGTLPRGLGRPQVQELAGVVPLVHGLRDVDALVALEADELAAGQPAERFGRLGLADAGLALEQQRPLQAERQEERGREPLVGQVTLAGERGRERFDVGERAAHSGHSGIMPDG
jgi:hypothetical protein